MNCASRFEALNKDFGSQIMVSDAVYVRRLDLRSATAIGSVTSSFAVMNEPMPIWRLA